MLLLGVAAARTSVILAVALGLVWLLRRHTASLRHAVLSIAIGCAALAPALGTILPSWTPIVTRSPAFIASAPAMIGPGAPPSSLAVSPSRQGADAASGLARGRPARTLERAEPPIPTVRSRARGLTLLLALDVVYVTGAIAALATLIAGLLRLAWISARAEPMQIESWTRQAAEVASAYRLRRPVRLRRSLDVAIPATWGVVRPQVLLPAGSEHWSDARIRAVLLHELAHVRRRDWIIQVLASAFRAVYWFNPLVWLACARLRHESERACDDLVVSHGVDVREYADHLLALARMFNQRAAAWTPAPSMARPSSLRRRTAAILDPAASHARAPRRSILSVAAFLLLVTGPVAAFHETRPAPQALPPHAVGAQPDRLAATTSPRIGTTAATVAVPPSTDGHLGTTAAVAGATPRDAPDSQSAAAPKRPDADLAVPSASPVGRSPQSVAIAVLDLIRSTFLNDPSNGVAHPFLTTTVDALQRAAQAVVGDSGLDPAALAAKSTTLLNALTNAANVADNIAGRPSESSENALALTKFADALQARAADLRAAALPVGAASSAGPSAIIETSPALGHAATAAMNAVGAARSDTSFLGPRLHTFLWTALDTVVRAAESAFDDEASDRATAAKRYALASALRSAANVASNIGSRDDETDQARRTALDLAATLRAIAAPLDDVIQPVLVIHLPPDVEPERVSIFYALAPSGQMPESIKTKPGVFDYTIDTTTVRDLKLLIFVPGYRIATAEFSDARLRSGEPYVPQLIPSQTSLRGRLVDSSGRPVRDYGLNLGYLLGETIRYFCGNCMLDGQIPFVPLGETRTDDAGAFSFVVPTVREDPFFQEYGAERGASAFYLSSASRGRFDMFDNTLRPSSFSPNTIGARTLIVTHVELGVLSGRLGPNFLRQHGLDDSFAAYRVGGLITPTPDRRPSIALVANPTDAANVATGIGGYNADLHPDGTFEVSLPPGTYDLTLNVTENGGAERQPIVVSRGVIIRERQRSVVTRP